MKGACALKCLKAIGTDDSHPRDGVFTSSDELLISLY